MPSIGEYLAGAAFLSLVLGLCAGAAVLAVRRALAHLRGGERALALFTLASGAVVLAHLVPGALGVLGRPAVAGCALLLLGAARLVPRAEAGAPAKPVGGEERVPRGSRWLAGIGVAAAAGGALGSLAAHAMTSVTAIDALTMHLPQVARFLQEGSITDLHQYLPDFATATYPHNGTMLLLASVLPWESTFAVRFVNAPFLAAVAGGVFLLARELRAPATTAALAAAAVTALPTVNGPALEQAQVDTPMLAWLVAGALFLLRASRSGSRGELVLAGIGLGLAFGTKWYAVAQVPVLVALWLAATRGRGIVLLLTAMAATGAAWFVRNWILTGNPVHPQPVRPLGVTVFDAPPDVLRERGGFSVADYLFDGRVWREYMIPAWTENLGLLGPLLLAAPVAALAALRARTAAATAVWASFALAAVYTVSPDTAFGPPGTPMLVGANTRYLVPALLASAVVAAWLATRGPRWRIAVEAGLLVGILEGAMRSYGPAMVLAAPAAATAVLALRAGRRRPRAAAAVGAVVLLMAGLVVSRTATFEDYRHVDPVVGRLLAERPASVAFGGVWAPGRISPVLPAFGPRLDARVEYLGRYVDGTLRRHDRARLVAHLREGAFEAVVVGRPGPEASWAEGAGYRVVARSPHLVLLLP